MNELIAALESLETKGSFYAKKSLPIAKLDIKVNKVGQLANPITDEQIAKLIAMAKPAAFGWKDQTIIDESVRKALGIPKSYVRIPKKQWNAVITPLLTYFKNQLGLPRKSELTATFHSMNIYTEGCFFKPHQDSEKEEGMVATLVIILPTEYEGGELLIDLNGKKTTIGHQTHKVPNYTLAAFYADCYHEVKPVTAGTRITLTYNLSLKNYTGNLSSLHDKDFDTRVSTALANCFSSDTTASPYVRRPPKVVYLLDHQYTQKGLSWSALKNNDSVRVNTLLTAADEQGLDAYLALADMNEVWECTFDYDSYRRRRYTDDSDAEPNPEYIICSEITLKHWMDREGKSIDMNGYQPDTEQIGWTGDNTQFDPYDSAYEGWTGNAGNTLERWYHRAALILWRKDDYHAVLFEIDKDSFADNIFILMEDNSNEKLLQTMLRQTAIYWENYACRHNDPSDIAQTMSLALQVNDLAISQALLIA